MTTSEILVEKIDHFRSVTTPANASAECLPHSWKLLLNRENMVVPAPVEFIDLTSSSFSPETISKVMNPDFIAEVYNTLSFLGLENVLGLMLHHRDSIVGLGDSLNEENVVRDRTSVLLPGQTVMENNIPTGSWFFDMLSVLNNVIFFYFKGGIFGSNTSVRSVAGGSGRVIHVRHTHINIIRKLFIFIVTTNNIINCVLLSIKKSKLKAII
jgi:hypothetical protein